MGLTDSHYIQLGYCINKTNNKASGPNPRASFFLIVLMSNSFLSRQAQEKKLVSFVIWVSVWVSEALFCKARRAKLLISSGAKSFKKY